MIEMLVDVRKCKACKACEIACAVEHSLSKNLLSAIAETPPPRNRVHVEKALSFSYPASCMHCADAPCVQACPKKAMSRDAESGNVSINEERCKGCMVCCPYGVITRDAARKVALKCDLCAARANDDKGPACVEACPTGALSLGDAKREQPGLLVSKAFAAAVNRARGEIKKTPPKRRRRLAAEAVVMALTNAEETGSKVYNA